MVVIGQFCDRAAISLHTLTTAVRQQLLWKPIPIEASSSPTLGGENQMRGLSYMIGRGRLSCPNIRSICRTISNTSTQTKPK